MCIAKRSWKNFVLAILGGAAAAVFAQNGQGRKSASDSTI